MPHEIGSDLKGRRVLALLPSRGLGGGIEAYFTALSEALCDLGAELETVTLQTPNAPRASMVAKARFALTSLLAARRLTHREGVLLLVLHPGLFPVGVLAQRIARIASAQCAVFFYGADIWGHSRVARRLPHRAGWRVVTISSFSAGALADSGPVAVLAPGIPQERYQRLATDAPTDQKPAHEVDVLSLFRLSSADPKGAFTLLRAGDILRVRRPDFSLVIAGSGRPPDDLRAAVDLRRHWVELREDVSFDDLAGLYHRAKVFVLATRSNAGKRGFRGEGFGIVLVEAQLAGTPVVAPCLGGSTDAFVDGVTGVRPSDESHDTLAETIERLLGDEELLKSLGENARSWAAERFHPHKYSERVGDLLVALQRSASP